MTYGITSRLRRWQDVTELLEMMRRAIEVPQASELAAICYQVYVQVKERREMELARMLDEIVVAESREAVPAKLD